MRLDIKKLIISLLIPQLAGAIGSLFTVPAIDNWYLLLNKASFNPPSWVFGPAWTTLFILMGLAYYFVDQSKSDKRLKFEAKQIFYLQLLFNTLWSIFFFGLRSPSLAFLEIIFLFVLILMTTLKFYKVNKVAAYLLIPYLLWVAFASVLNFTVIILN